MDEHQEQGRAFRSVSFHAENCTVRELLDILRDTPSWTCVYYTFHSVTFLKLNYGSSICFVFCFQRKDKNNFNTRFRLNGADKFHTWIRLEDTDKFHTRIRLKYADKFQTQIRSKGADKFRTRIRREGADKFHEEFDVKVQINFTHEFDVKLQLNTFNPRNPSLSAYVVFAAVTGNEARTHTWRVLPCGHRVTSAHGRRIVARVTLTVAKQRSEPQDSDKIVWASERVTHIRGVPGWNSSPDRLLCMCFSSLSLILARIWRGREHEIGHDNIGLQFLNRRSIVVSPDSCSGDLEFDSQRRTWLTWLRSQFALHGGQKGEGESCIISYVE